MLCYTKLYYTNTILYYSILYYTILILCCILCYTIMTVSGCFLKPIGRPESSWELPPHWQTDAVGRWGVKRARCYRANLGGSWVVLKWGYK